MLNCLQLIIHFEVANQLMRGYKLPRSVQAKFSSAGLAE